MKRYGRAALLFAAGVVVGLLLASSRPTRTATRDEWKEPFGVRRADEKSVYLVPYSLCVDGRSEPVAPKGAGPMWVIQFNGAKVQIAATEERDPR